MIRPLGKPVAEKANAEPVKLLETFKLIASLSLSLWSDILGGGVVGGGDKGGGKTLLFEEPAPAPVLPLATPNKSFSSNIVLATPTVSKPLVTSTTGLK